MSRLVRILAIVVFVVADIALGVAAWTHVHREPAHSGLDVTQLTASPEVSVGVPSNQPFELEPANVVMVDADATGTVIITARRGACKGEPPVVRVSSDGGKTLTTVNPGVSEVLAVMVDGKKATLSVVGTDAKCAIVAKSTDDGSTWKDAPPGSVTGWYGGTGDVSAIVTPAGPSKPGCEVSSLSAIDDAFARVSCTDGRVRGTGDAGKSWTTLGKLDGVRVTSFSDYTNGVALARYEGCADYTFATTDGGRTWRPQGCVGGDSAQALSGDGARLVAVVDQQVAVSADRGKTWTIHELAQPAP